MNNLIDKKAVLDALDQIKWSLWEIDIPSPTVPEYIEHHRDVQSVMKRVDEIREKIESLPSSQPEIGRCKDCKWWGKAGCAISIVDASDRPKENDFCSFAERKDNG